MKIKQKKVIFMGEKPLGYQCLNYLQSREDVEIVGICTRKKTPVWWGQQYVREFANQHKLKLIPRKTILELDVDVIISVLYPFIIEKDIIDHANDSAINLHQAPLPEYRGCNSTSHAIINGENRFGCTLHMLEEGLDTGQVIEKRYLAINANETAWELYQRVDMLCFEMFKDQIGNILSGQYTTEEQDLSLPSRIYERTSLEQKEVDLTWEHDKIWNFVRGMEFKPFQPACIMIKGNRKIYLTTKVNTDE